jgi:hypothetical protein
VLGWVLEHHGLAALGLTAGLSAVALLLLMLLKMPGPPS